MTIPRRRWMASGLFVLAIVAVLGWRVTHRVDPAARYRAAPVVLGDLDQVITANGTLNPVRVVSVGTQVSGTIQSLAVNFNDPVRAGELLAEIDPSVYRARLAQSEAAADNLRASLVLARANQGRGKQLFDAKFISAQDYETFNATAAGTAAQVQAAEAQVAQDRANLGYTFIRSPVDGVVISRQDDNGQTVAASFQTPTLFTIARDLTQMQIEAAVAEADVAKVVVGQRVTFTVDAFGARAFEGRVQQIRLNPTTQQNVVTYTVIVAVPNPDKALLPGMTANASFRVQDFHHVLLLPNAALSWKPANWTAETARAGADAVPEDPAAFTVFRLGKAGPEAVRVRLGAADVDHSIVTAGALRAGDRVITGTREPAGAPTHPAGQ